LPATLPPLCAIFVIYAAGMVRDRFDETSRVCCSARDVALPAQRAQSALPKPHALPADLYAARVTFVAAAQVQVVAIAATVTFGGALLLPLLCEGRRTARRIFALTVVAGAVASATYELRPDTFFAFHHAVATTIATEFEAIERWRIGFEQATSIAASLLVAILSLLLLPPAGSIERRIKITAEHNRRLTYVLILGTIVLAGSALLKTCLGRWITAYFDPPSQQVVRSFVESIVSGWAVYDSLFLAVTYVPAAVVLRLRLRRYAEEIDLKAPPPWYEPQWLTSSPLQDLSRVLAILAPLLVGQASDIVSFLQ
jgi:hypothetical protein